MVSGIRERLAINTYSIEAKPAVIHNNLALRFTGQRYRNETEISNGSIVESKVYI